MVFYEESLRVPLVMRYPNGMPSGLRLDAPAAGADVGPTILDYCQGKPLVQFHGRSLKAVIEGGDSSTPYAYSDLRNRQCLRSTAWKLECQSGEPILFFDLQEDPLEKVNLLDSGTQFGEAQKALEEMGQILKSQYVQVSKEDG